MNMPRNESAPGATLRALNHAQGQLMQSHDDLLFYFAADTLEVLRRENVFSAIAAACPDASPAAAALAPLAADSAARERLFSWERNRAMIQARDALRAIAAYCDTRTARANDKGDFRRAAMIAGAASAYLDMAEEVRNPGLRDIFHIASRVNPYISAVFVAEYAGIIARRLESQPVKSPIYAALSHRLNEQRSLILSNLAADGNTAYAPVPAHAGKAAPVMTRLSETADIAEQTLRALKNLGNDDRRLETSLAALFQTAAVYDWQQYQTGRTANPGNDNRHPRPLAPVIPLFGAPGGMP